MVTTPTFARMRQVFGLAGLAASVFRRTAFAPFPHLTLADRLATLPTKAPVSAEMTIRWNDQHIPFVEAATMRDAAVGLGIVHGHLRLAQMELMRRAATGRISQIAGKPALELDTLLRLIDFPRAREASVAKMPDETRTWIAGFADGINAAAQTLPPEFDALQIPFEPWTPDDLFAVSRLASADYAWKVWRTLNALRKQDDWAEMWADLVGVAAVADEDIPVGAEQLDEALPTAFARHGSNAYAIAGSRTQSGAPIVACDPHLVVSSPSIWLIAGFSVPGHTVWGLMIPALPIFGAGRNENGAWGGTNLHATSSELVDVAGEEITTRTTTIPIKGGGAEHRRLRETRFGPVISDAKPFAMPAETVSLHWLGHRGSDEFTPFLDLMKATDWESFEAAIDAYALPGLNMIWGGNDGTIGKMIGAHIPTRPLSTPGDLITSVADTEAQWRDLVTGRDLPQSVNPPEGFVASANEAPEGSPVTISFFYSAPTRVERIAALIGDETGLTVADIMRFHADVYDAPAHALCQRLARLAAVRPGPVADALASWDGRYGAGSEGALAFELVAKPLIDGLEVRLPRKPASPHWRPFARLSRLADAADDAALTSVLADAIESAEDPFRWHRTWGGLHRLALAHPFAKLPWLSGRLQRVKRPAAGSNDTLMKSMHPFTQKRHATGFAANARFIADLSDPDATHAMLLCGQDGWPNSETMFDMVGPWQRSQYATLPMRAAVRAKTFPHETTVAPAE
ncbi:MAG: penicillin acylase family protein [Pseudomonadota bacterium]